jgi:uncharacterized protein YjbI with pentapeptide repeats
LSNANLISTAELGSTTLTNANLTGAILSGAHLDAIVDAVGANFTNANLELVNFQDANLYGAVGMDTANVNEAVWSNTTCPDGTNSDNNGNTCEGHLTP